jgi:hypothetical protein
MVIPEWFLLEWWEQLFRRWREFLGRRIIGKLVRLTDS